MNKNKIYDFFPMVARQNSQFRNTNQSINPIYVGQPNKRLISIMINVSWGNQYVLELLEIMKNYNCKLTFFLDGLWVHKYPHLAREIRDRGHEIGSHAYSHLDMRGLTDEYMKWELKMTNEILFKELKVTPNLFTPPYAACNERIVEIASQEGMTTIISSLDTQDWYLNHADTIIDKVNSNVKNGSIILIHPTEVTVKALPSILKLILNRNLKLCTVSKLLSL
ncbi:polysaccharide deacetylase family protein [Bacillus sp. C1]